MDKKVFVEASLLKHSGQRVVLTIFFILKYLQIVANIQNILKKHLLSSRIIFYWEKVLQPSWVLTVFYSKSNFSWCNWYYNYSAGPNVQSLFVCCLVSISKYQLKEFWVMKCLLWKKCMNNAKGIINWIIRIPLLLLFLISNKITQKLFLIIWNF